MTTYQLGYLSSEILKKEAIKIKDVRYSKSLKNRECVYCGCEIPKNDLYYSYKPVFGKRKARCLEHSPKIYNDYERYDV